MDIQDISTQLAVAGVQHVLVEAKAAPNKKWIQTVTKSMQKKGTEGSLHRYFKIPEDETIPVSLMKKALKDPKTSEKTRKRIQFALNMRSVNTAHSSDSKSATDSANADSLKKWKKLINMTSSQLKSFLATDDGKEAGLSKKAASDHGISSGHSSASAILRMKAKPVSKWTDLDWKWCRKQISFVSRMLGNKGPLYDDKGNKTRKHTSLLLWGHNPSK